MRATYKLIVLFCLICSTNALAANWLLVSQKNDGAKYYIDKNSVNYISGLNRVNYNVMANETVRDADGNISYLENSVVNCQDGIYVLVYVEAFKQPGLGGRKSPREYLNNPKPYNIDKRTVGGQLALEACRLSSQAQ